MSSARPAYGLEQIADGLASAQNVHIVHYGSTGTPFYESWKSGTKKRYKFSASGLHGATGGRQGVVITDRGFDGKRVWCLQDNNSSASIRTEAPIGFGTEQNPSVETIAANFRKSAKGSVRKSVQTSASGVEYTFEDAPAKRRLVVQIEPNGRRPLKVEYFHNQDGQWNLSSGQRFEYPVTIGDDVFAFRPPEGYIVYDFDEIVEGFDKNISGAGESKSVNGVTIRLVGAYKSEDGSVIVVWTGGACPPPLARVGAYEKKGIGLRCDVIIEGDDRNRPKNHGIAPKVKPKPVTRDQWIETIRPLGYRRGVPFYGMRAILGSGLKHWIAPGSVPEKNSPVELTVVLPVCKSIAPKLVRPKKGWVLHRVVSEQVGNATFHVTARPVDQFFNLIYKLDPEHMPMLGSTPMTSMDLPKK